MGSALRSQYCVLSAGFVLFEYMICKTAGLVMFDYIVIDVKDTF